MIKIEIFFLKAFKTKQFFFHVPTCDFFQSRSIDIVESEIRQHYRLSLIKRDTTKEEAPLVIRRRCAKTFPPTEPDGHIE